MHVNVVFILSIHIYICTQFKKITAETGREENRIHNTFKGHSSSVRLDYTEEFDFISSVSLCHGRCGEGNGNTLSKQLQPTACYQQMDCGNYLTSMKIVTDRKIELRKKLKLKKKNKKAPHL